jgi:hypothetical protein
MLPAVSTAMEAGKLIALTALLQLLVVSVYTGFVGRENRALVVAAITLAMVLGVLAVILRWG